MIRLVLLFLGISFSSCHQQEEKKLVTGTKKGNTAVTRIVCLFDPLMDAIYMLGEQHKLIGIPSEVYSDKELYIPYSLLDERIKTKAIPTPGTNSAVNLESVISLKPDLLIVQQISPSARKTIESFGIIVYQGSSNNLEEIKKELFDLGKLLGKEDRVNELLDFMNLELDSIRQKHKAGTGYRKSVYFSWANGKIFSTAGTNSIMHSCLEFAEVDNVCNSPMDQTNVNPELLVLWNPDIIIMWNDSAEIFYAREDLAKITAVKNKSIYNLMPMFFYNPHTLKFLCASVFIYSYAYEQNTITSKQKVMDICNSLYGSKLAERIKKIYFL